MKLRFKIQPYQTAAVESVVDCFAGQSNLSGMSYRIDPGKELKIDTKLGLKNAELVLSRKDLLENIQKVQLRQNLPVSKKLKDSAGRDIEENSESWCPINLDVEMETGTGKTYCYIKTMFELNRRYGWTKFIVMVPSIAIREGVSKSLAVTAGHFQETYGKKAHFFTYNSKFPHNLESFSSSADLNVMVINIQAFNAVGKDNLRIYEELDDFGTRRPIDVISANRPILILDEPQKMEGKKTLDALKKFNPLMILRYSATHRVEHNRVHRLDALDAYNQKLVKRIGVHGISVKGLSGTNAYLYLEDIEVSSTAPVARMEMEIKQKGGSIKRITRKIGKGENLFDTSCGLDEYKGYVVSQIDAANWSVEFTNGVVLHTGEASGNVNEGMLRRLQIREAVRAHLDTEMRLYPQGIKVLSLFFIDEVAKYRDYGQPENKGEYAHMFEEEYNLQVNELLHCTLPVQGERYREYLESISADRTHNGYFSIDKKSRRLVDPSIIKRGEDKGLSDDVDAYDLILKDKERLLSFEEPTRFIFSHSALREGWDNPNIFVMCMLKHSDSSISRRQEVGRGLRLCVNQQGERMDNPMTAHQLNVLTVVTSESYTDFVSNLQKEIRETISDRPRKADANFFKNKVLKGADGSSVAVDDAMANRIYAWLLKNDYIDEATNEISQNYHEAKSQGTFCPMRPELEPYRESILSMVDSLYLCIQGIPVTDESKSRTNHLNDNFKKEEFQALWNRINHKAVYRVDFDSSELIHNCIDTLNAELKVTPLKYVVVTGMQRGSMTTESLEQGTGFTIKKTETEFNKSSVHSLVKYDLLGKLAELTKLTRKTLALMLSGIHSGTFDLFRQNPEEFISESGRLINEQKATCIIEQLSYDCLSERYDSNIFTEAQIRLEGDAGQKLQKHIYDYVATQSGVERRFVKELDTDQDVVVYAKLPRGFFIPTPVGPYNPDWAIAFREGSVKHIYFVAETKGSMSSMELRGEEKTRIACARKFFNMLTEKLNDNRVIYDVVDSYDKLMNIVKA